MTDLEAVKKALPDTPVLANTGVKHATVADVLKVADGCIVGSSLKVDGNTWNAGRSRSRGGIHAARPRRAEGLSAWPRSDAGPTSRSACAR